MSTMVDPPQARSALTEALAVLKPEWERNLTALQNGWLDTLQAASSKPRCRWSPPTIQASIAPGKQAKANKHEAERYADALRPILVELCHMRIETIADELMRRKIGTPRGGRWHGRTVARLLDRLHWR